MEARAQYIPGMMPAIFTADELLQMSLPDKQVELVRGMLVVREPPGYVHGRVAGNVAYDLTRYVRSNDLGVVLAAETGFKIFADPDTVRAPDVAFIRRDRMPEPPPPGYAAQAPDLVVEVLSPHDRPGEVLAKVGDWLSAGCRLVWVIDPRRRGARVYRADGSESFLTETDTLDGEDVVPGLTIPLSSVL